MSASIVIGPYADPPVFGTYERRKREGWREYLWLGMEQKLASGGWHYTEHNAEDGRVREWFEVPDENGVMRTLHVVRD